jgi:hypothetical protein
MLSIGEISRRFFGVFANKNRATYFSYGEHLRKSSKAIMKLPITGYAVNSATKNKSRRHEPERRQETDRDLLKVSANSTPHTASAKSSASQPGNLRENAAELRSLG